jgi:hypothetical protein
MASALTSVPRRDESSWLWSRRSRVRVPSLTPQKAPLTRGFSVSEDHKLVSSWAQYGLNLCADLRDIGPQALTRAQQLGLITRRSRVRIPPPLLEKPAGNGGVCPFSNSAVAHCQGGNGGAFPSSGKGANPVSWAWTRLPARGGAAAFAREEASAQRAAATAPARPLPTVISASVESRATTRKMA